MIWAASLIAGGWIQVAGGWTSNYYYTVESSPAGGSALRWSVVHAPTPTSSLYTYGEMTQYRTASEWEILAFPALGVSTGSNRIRLYLELQGSLSTSEQYPARSWGLAAGVQSNPVRVELRRNTNLSYPLDDWSLEVQWRARWSRGAWILYPELLAGGILRTAYTQSTPTDAFWGGGAHGGWMRPSPVVSSTTRAIRARGGISLVHTPSYWTSWGTWIVAQRVWGDDVTPLPDAPASTADLLLGTAYAYHALEGGGWFQTDLPGHLQVRGAVQTSWRRYTGGREDRSVEIRGGVERALRLRWTLFVEGSWFLNRSSDPEASLQRVETRVGIRYLW